jgi:D-beta-D-heptose 7-phosphate kinase/D-beta-D-heptose 1-phosphate adenosyltransferase
MRYIMTNGAYDILHPGHIALLNYAKSLGDYLMVAIDTDSRISEAKGPDRPVNNLQTRKCILENLKAVDEVRVFTNDEELVTIIKEYNPDVRVIGSDWKNGNIVGEEFCKSIEFFDRVNDESTTNTLENYIDRRQLHRPLYLR